MSKSIKMLVLAVFMLFGMCFTSMAEDIVTENVLAETSEAVVIPVATPVNNFSVMDIIKKIPALKQGVGFSVLDNKFNYLTTFDVFNYKAVNLEAGYSGANANTGDKIVSVLSYDLWDAKKAGVTIPVLDLVKFRPGVYIGVGRVLGSNEFDYGVSATLIDVKF